jgi:tetratricopeptide (TPR) repeat protein
MRAKIALSVALIAFSGCAAAADAPVPQGCADYTSNKTGGDPTCDGAIAAEQDPKAKSVLLFRRAYMEDAAGDFKAYPKAFADLDEAIRLWPQNPAALHERGYLYNEEGRWKEAEKDLDAQIALMPADPRGYQERALSRFKLGKLDQALEDDSALVMLEPNKAANYFARARAELWTGKFDAARADIDKALALAPGDKDAAKAADDLRAELATWTKRSSSVPAMQACADADKNNALGKDGAIGDCTRAFLDASTPDDKAHALTYRAMAWLAAEHDPRAATSDSEVAAALDPNAATLANLGFAYLRGRHSTAAIQEFDRSIALHADFWNYAGRAAAKLNIGDFQGALEDAKQSIAIKLNTVALIVEGDTLYAQTKSYGQAKTFWLQAWSMGDHDDDLAARLKDAGVTPPADKPAGKKP